MKLLLLLCLQLVLLYDHFVLHLLLEMFLQLLLCVVSSVLLQSLVELQGAVWAVGGGEGINAGVAQMRDRRVSCLRRRIVRGVHVLLRGVEGVEGRVMLLLLLLLQHQLLLLLL